MTHGTLSLGVRFLPRIACAIACLVFCIHAFLWTPRLTYGFAMYYAYARLALRGESLDRVYDDAYFQGKLREFGFDLRDEPNNAPTASLALAPVAWLPPLAARIVWSCLSLSAFAFAIFLLFRLSGIPPSGTVGAWLLTLVFLWKPAYDNVAFGQVYFLLLLLFVLSMGALMRRDAGQAAWPLTLAILIKGYGAVPLLLLAAKRMWKEVRFVLLFALGLVVATLPLLGRVSWQVFLSTVVPSLGALPSHAHVAYQTINGFIRHLTTFDPLWSPHPAFVMPALTVMILSYGLNATVIVLVLMRCRQAGPGDLFLAFGIALSAGVVTAPLAEEYHYVLFLPLVFAIAAELAARPGEWRNARLLIPAAAVFLLATPLNYKALQYAAFPAVLLAYPKLYGGLAFIAYSCGVLKRRNPAGEGVG